MARTKTTKKKPQVEMPNLKTRLPCLKCNKTFLSISSLKIHFKESHGPTSTWYECNHCFASFTRKLNAICHLKDKHADKPTDHFTQLTQTPKENAQSVRKWIPPFESVTKSTIKPTFKIRHYLTPLTN